MKPNIIPFTDSTAPRAPFEQGSTPRAAWFCIETTFCHDTPQPEAMLHAHGLYAYADEDPLACCTQYGLDKEVATPETLQQLAAAFAAQDADGRGVLLTRDHAGLGTDPDTRACGWIKALHAEGDRLWAWIELTPYGHALIDSAEFAFFSTEYKYADFVKTDNGAEPQRLSGCSLTNMPRHGAQPSCTNMAQGGQTARNSQTKNNTMDTDPENKTVADNDDDDQQKLNAANNDNDPAAANDDNDDPAANNDDNDPAAVNDDNDDPAAANDDNGEMDMQTAVTQIAELMELPDTATPADFLGAVKALVKSNDELRTALAEANKTAAVGSNSRRFPGLAFARNSRTPLRGSKPNGEVKVRVGNKTVAVNGQQKAKADYCTAAVNRKERTLGRSLTTGEYTQTWAKASRDFETGNNR